MKLKRWAAGYGLFAALCLAVCRVLPERQMLVCQVWYLTTVWIWLILAAVGVRLAEKLRRWNRWLRPGKENKE